jgi:hypothetical protein
MDTLLPALSFYPDRELALLAFLSLLRSSFPLHFPEILCLFVSHSFSPILISILLVPPSLLDTNVIQTWNMHLQRFNFFKGCPKAKTATIVLRGGGEQFLEETDRWVERWMNNRGVDGVDRR